MKILTTKQKQLVPHCKTGGFNLYITHAPLSPPQFFLNIAITMYVLEPICSVYKVNLYIEKHVQTKDIVQKQSTDNGYKAIDIKCVHDFSEKMHSKDHFHPHPRKKLSHIAV